MTLLRLIAAVTLLSLAGCGGIGRTTVPDELASLGEFRLGYNIVVAKNAQKVPISRDASTEELEAALKTAVQERFGGYDGRKIYHIGINVDAYALAPPGVPIVVSPKSVLVVSVSIWDDARQRKLTELPKQFTLWENLTGETVIGSGLTQSAEQQLRNLALNAARAIEGWMLENPAWFEITPEEEAHLAELSAAAEAKATEEARAAGTLISPNPRPKLRPQAITVAAEAQADAAQAAAEAGASIGARPGAPAAEMGIGAEIIPPMEGFPASPAEGEITQETLDFPQPSQ